MPSLIKDYGKPDIIREIRAKEPDVPIISPSQISSYNSCAWSWHLRYVRGYFPLPTNDTSEVGLLVHFLLQVGYESKKENPTKPYSFHKGKVQEALLSFKDRFTTYDQMVQLKRAGNIVLMYFDTIAQTWDQGHMVVGVEKHYVVPFYTPTGNKYYLQGYIDLLEAMTGGRYRVEDHKSTPDKQRFYTPDQVQFDHQLKGYCIILRALGYKANDVAIRNYNTYDYKNGPESRPHEDLFKRTTAHYTDKELDSFQEELGLLVDEMFFLGLPIRRTVSRDCSRCWVREPCLFEMKGMNSGPVLRTKFSRRREETIVELIIGVDKTKEKE